MNNLILEFSTLQQLIDNGGVVHNTEVTLIGTKDSDYTSELEIHHGKIIFDWVQLDENGVENGLSVEYNNQTLEEMNSGEIKYELVYWMEGKVGQVDPNNFCLPYVEFFNTIRDAEGKEPIMDTNFPKTDPRHWGIDASEDEWNEFKEYQKENK